MSLDAKFAVMQGIPNVQVTGRVTAANTNNQALSYLNSGPRMDAYLAWEHNYLNPPMPQTTFRPQAKSLTPDQLAMINYLQKETFLLGLEANQPRIIQEGDSLPYGMTRPTWMFPWDPCSGNMNIGLGFPYRMACPSIMYLNNGFGNVSRSKASLGVGVGGSLLGAPISAAGNAFSEIGQSLLEFSGWTG